MPTVPKPIDKSNPKNIYCAHCKSAKDNGDNYICNCPTSQHYNKQRHYWNRCKSFSWK